MPSSARRLAEALGLAAGSGSWARRVVLGLVGNRAGAKGSWLRRLRDSETVDASEGTGSWARRLAESGGAAGSWLRRMADDPDRFRTDIPDDGHWPPQAPDGTEALVALDFVEGVYWAGGELVELTDALVEDANWGSFDPSDVIPGEGLRGPANRNSNPVIHAGIDLLLGGFTWVAELETLDDSAISGVALTIADDTGELYLYCNVDSFGNSSFRSPMGDNVDQVYWGPVSVGAHKVAASVLPVAMTRSKDGGAVQAYGPTQAWVPAPTLVNLSAAYQAVLKRIAFYSPQNDADLPSMSAP